MLAYYNRDGACATRDTLLFCACAIHRGVLLPCGPLFVNLILTQRLSDQSRDRQGAATRESTLLLVL